MTTQLTAEQRQRLKDLALPIARFLAGTYDPYTSVVVTQSRVTIKQEITGSPLTHDEVFGQEDS